MGWFTPTQRNLREMRLVLPAAAVESHRARGGCDTAPAPRLLGFDPPIPRWLSTTYGGCWRLRVRMTPHVSSGDVNRVEYNCTAPALPVKIIVFLDMAIREGDCNEPNALELKNDGLKKREVDRVEVAGAAGGDVQLATVYCIVTVRVVPHMLWGILLWVLILLVHRRLEAAVKDIAHWLLKRYWQSVTKNWAVATAETPQQEGVWQRLVWSVPAPGGQTGMLDGSLGTASAADAFGGNGLATSPTSAARPLNEGSSQGAAAGVSRGLTINPSDPVDVADDVALRHPCEQTKGMPYYNGFLYKLGDGLLNTTWNLRYFLLIGSQLQYYRSQHEAKPRDAINLSGSTVKWDKDQSRPFAFTVSKTGQRPLCLSGNTEQETREWLERIQAASKVEGAQPSTPGGRSSRRLPHQFLAEASGEPAEKPAGPAAEAALQACAQALAQGSIGEGYRLREIRGGLRITGHVDAASVAVGPPPSGSAAAALTLLAVIAALLRTSGLSLHLAGPCAAAAIILLRILWPSQGGAGAPVICASAHVNGTSEEICEALNDPTFFAEWRPGHLEGWMLSLVPVRDEILFTRFRMGALGLVAHLRTRRRWTRNAEGVRLLCTVAEAGSGSGCGGISGVEGFAVLPCEEGGCNVVWLCGLDLLPWAPQRLREHVAVLRVGSLAGLREWFAGPVAKRHSAAAIGVRDPPAPAGSTQSAALLRGCRRGAAGGLHLPRDTERAAIIASAFLGMGHQALRGGHSVATSASPHGLLTQPAADLAPRYAARWAYASLFLPEAGATDKARDRLVLVIAFVVAGLHLAAIAYPHFPWVVWAPGPAKHTLVLGDDVRVRVEVNPGVPLAKDRPDDGSPVGQTSWQQAQAHGRRHSKFEVLAKSALGFRIAGTDEVSCCLDLPGSLRFIDRGITTVEFASGCAVRFTLPQLHVSPSAWSLGHGSVYEWRGCAHFVDEAAGVQCELFFGRPPPDKGLGTDAVTGTVRDALGYDVARIRGSWLGPLLCDNEVLWRGPRQQPTSY